MPSPHSDTAQVGGLLFVALPAASLNNSRYMDQDRFNRLVCSLGFETVSSRVSKKIATVLFLLVRPYTGYNSDTRSFMFGPKQLFSRELVRPGSRRNNFSIMLKSTTHGADSGATPDVGGKSKAKHG